MDRPPADRSPPLTSCAISPGEGGTADRPGRSLSWQQIDDAAALARRLLRDDAERFSHSAAVAARATDLSAAVEMVDRPLLVAAAWLHDIGYSREVALTGFHPLDGARYLRSARWPDALCELVAHHSGSRYIAVVRGFGSQLAEFENREGPVSDALTVADQTVGPHGHDMTIDERMADMLARHGPHSPNAMAHSDREQYLRAAARRVALRLRAIGIAPD